MNQRYTPETAIPDALEGITLAGRVYPSPLPDELAPWHVYIADCGHSILVTLGEDLDMAVPAPVKTVLRHGWKVLDNGLIHADLPYDPTLGLLTDPSDDEFAEPAATTVPKIREFAVGKLYHPGVTHWPDEHAEWKLSEDGVQLLLTYASPTEDEVRAVAKGRARFALIAGDHALILAHRFEPLNWSDSPWQATRQIDQTAGLPYLGPGGHLPITVFMIDADTGLIAAIRQTSWNHRFTEAVRKALSTQIRNGSPTAAAQGDTEIDAWYRRYPTTDALVAAADITTEPRR
ncbi:hypothetical protein ACWEVD_00555 [Nocardia thailandica]